MPSWDQVLEELGKTADAKGKLDCDRVRRKYLSSVANTTGRCTILYASKFTSPSAVNPAILMVSDEDIQGLMTVIHGLPGTKLDLILHSPGGSLSAVESFVYYLRSKFDHIRVIVPQLAMSAATMIACAADEILMGKHSFLGPIDPQFVLATSLGQRMVPAQAILAQFDRAKKECQDPTMLGAWMPMLSQYGPDLLVQCQNASDMSRGMVEDWLARYMFRDDKEAAGKAATIAEWLSTHEEHKSHARHISRDELEAKGLNIKPLEKNQNIQDLFLSIFHATTLTFDHTHAVKIIENHMGKAFVKASAPVPVPFPLPPGRVPPGGLPQLGKIPPSS